MQCGMYSHRQRKSAVQVQDCCSEAVFELFVRQDSEIIILNFKEEIFLCQNQLECNLNLINSCRHTHQPQTLPYLENLYQTSLEKQKSEKT